MQVLECTSNLVQHRHDFGCTAFLRPLACLGLLVHVAHMAFQLHALVAVLATGRGRAAARAGGLV